MNEIKAMQAAEVPNWVIPSFDTNPLKPGTFYLLLVNKDNATLLIEKPISGNFIYNTDLNPNDFIVDDSGVVRLNQNVIKQVEFNPAQFTVGLDGMVHLKNNPQTNGENVVINFNPTLTNQCGAANQCTNTDAYKKLSVEGLTTVPLSDSIKDVITVSYKLSNTDYLETGVLTILTRTECITFRDSKSVGLSKDVTLNAKLNANSIELEITPQVGGVFEFSYNLTTL